MKNTDLQILLFLILAFAVGTIAVGLFSPIEMIISQFRDDSYYYLKIAQNTASGLGVTFDGLHRTNGFHPLWLAILVPMAAMFQDPEQLIRAVFCLTILIRAGSATIAYLVFRELFESRVIPIVASLVFFVLSSTWGTYGMEDSILNLMLLATLLFILKLNLYPRTIAAAVSLGLLITLTVYSRLDAVFLCFAFFPIALACLLIDARPWMAGTVIPTLLRLSIAGIIPVLAVLGYIYLNSLYFDTATPISGKLKSTFPDIVDVAPYWLGASFTQKISIVLVLIQTPIIIGLGIIRRLSRKPSAPVLVLAVWSTYISLFVLYQLLFGKWANTSGWYRLPLMLVLTASFFLVVDIVVGRMQQLGFRRLGTAAIGMTILVAAAAGFRYLDIHSRQTEAFPVVAREVGKWVQHNTDEDAIFALKDTGAFGYFSDRRVINLDGLVNTKEYQDFAVENGISRYFDRENVSYIVAQSLGEFPDEVKSGDYCSHDQAIHSFMYDTTMGSYTVYREDEVFRLPYQKGKKYWVIWKRTTDSDAESRCPG